MSKRDFRVPYCIVALLIAVSAAAAQTPCEPVNPDAIPEAHRVWLMTRSGMIEQQADRIRTAYGAWYLINRGDPMPGDASFSAASVGKEKDGIH